MSGALTKNPSPWLWLLLCATFALVWHASQQGSEIEIAQPKKVMTKQQLNHAHFSAQMDVDGLKIVTRKSIESQTDLFAVVRPKVFVPTAIKAPIQKMAPILPPLPFKYIGQWKDDAGLQVLLEHNGEVLTVKAGDELLGRYQVLAIEETPLNIVVEFLAMPENQKQLLQVGKAKNE